MDKKFSEFVLKLFSGLGVPVYTVTLPCDDWTWLDLGLRKAIFGTVDHDKINRRLAEHDEKAVYHLNP